MEPLPPTTPAATTPAASAKPPVEALALRPAPMRHVLFTYGTMQRGNRNHGRIEGAIPIGAATTTARYTLWCMGYAPGMTAKGTTAVQGECYVIDDLLLAKIDRAEGTPWKYRRSLIHVTLDGGHKMQAWAYILDRVHLDSWDTVIAGGKWVQPKDSHEQYLQRSWAGLGYRYTYSRKDDRKKGTTRRVRELVENWDWDLDPMVCPECGDHCRSSDIWCTSCGCSLDGYEREGKRERDSWASELTRYLKRERKRVRGGTAKECDSCFDDLIWDADDLMHLCPRCDYDAMGNRLIPLGKSSRKSVPLLSEPPVDAPGVQAALKAEAAALMSRLKKMREVGKTPPEGK